MYANTFAKNHEAFYVKPADFSGLENPIVD